MLSYNFRNKARISAVTTCIYVNNRGSSYCNKRKNGERRKIRNIGKEKIKLSSFTNKMIICNANYKAQSSKKLLE